MKNQDWVEMLYRNNYERLFALGLSFVSRNPLQIQMLEDAIQEVFYELIKKSDTLKAHENIEGWLIVTLRLKLKEQFRKQKRDEKWNEFSFNEKDSHDVAIKEIEAAHSQRDGLQMILEQEKFQSLVELLGAENAKLFIMYCVNKEPSKVVAREFGLTENALWVKVSRIRKKILNNPDLFMAISLILFKSM